LDAASKENNADMNTPKISYRDALSDIITDPEELEVMLEWIDAHKNWGAFRMPKFPSHTLVTLIDAIKRMKEQQLAYYLAKGE
jgi:hypothetical protein